MSEVGDQVAVNCPACSPTIETLHEVLTSNGDTTVRCLECQHVHRAKIETHPPTREVRTVVSQAGDSITTTIDVPDDAVFSVGQEFVVETDEAVFSVELTDIEGVDGARHDQLDIGDTATLWTRDIGNVAVPVTIHPPKRSERTSRSTTMHVPGDRMFEIGTEETIGDEPVSIFGILLRDDRGERKLNDPGERAIASDIDRLYVRSQRRVPREPW